MIGKIMHILNIIWKYAKIIIFAKVFLIIFVSIISTLKIYVNKELINEMTEFLTENKYQRLIIIIFCFLIIMFGDICLSWFNGRIDVKCDKIFTNTLEPAIIKKLQHLSYESFEDNEIKNIISRATGQSYQNIKATFLQILEIVQIVFSLIGLCSIFISVSIWLVLLLFITLIPNLYINYKSGVLWSKLYSEQTEDERELEYFNDLFTTKGVLVELKIFCALRYVERLWRKKTDKLISYKMKALHKVQLYLALKGVISAIWFIEAGIFALTMFIDNSITLGLLVAIIESVTIVNNYCERISNDLQSLSRDVYQCDFLFKLFQLEEQQNINVTEGKRIIEEIETIEFQHVYFKYPKTEMFIINDLSFIISKFDKVALVGRNGAGKSTIIKLLCKLYKPNSGKILINGIDLLDISMTEICGLMSIVFQDYFCYEMSIRENVALGNLRYMKEDKKILQALEKSGMRDIVYKTLQGLDTPLGKLESNGIDLSGGQWQKLAIARAYLAETSFVILDEPTASLDPVAESNMYELFSEIMKDHTTLMVSHRLGSSKIADRIFVLDHGKIVEEGNHHELMSLQGEYYAMFSSQAHWYLKEATS